MTAREALPALLKSFVRYYDIKEEGVQPPFAAEAEFHSHEEQFFLVKQAKLSEAESKEFVFFAVTEHLTLDERNALIKEQPAYGNIICRCEMISEGEILDAIHRPLGARSLDGVKRRTRAGMGRCQAGFCSPRTMEILAREVPMEMSDITKNGGSSTYIVGTNKNI